MDINMEIISIINGTKARSAWNNGVKDYAVMLMGNMEDVELWELNKADAHSRITKKLLNGAQDWLDVQARALYQACRLVLNACDEIKDRYVINEYGTVIDYAAAVSLMDEDIRQALECRLAPCSNQAFFTAYEHAHAEKYGEDDWELSKLNPCY